MKKILILLLVIPIVLTGCSKKNKVIKELPEEFTYEYRYGLNVSTKGDKIFIDPGLNKEKFINAYNEKIETNKEKEKKYDLKLKKDDSDNIEMTSKEVNIRIISNDVEEYNLSLFMLNNKIYVRVYETEEDEVYYYKELSSELSTYFSKVIRIIMDTSTPYGVKTTTSTTTTETTTRKAKSKH